MPKFHCKHCGMITDNPVIDPHLERNDMFREPISARIKLSGEYYNYSITCPVCENETRFWREEPFPTDDLHRTTLKEQMEYYLSSISAHLV